MVNHEVRDFVILSHCQALVALLLLIPVIFCQQNLADYTQAEQFVPANVIPLLYNMSVTPNWIDGTDNFWYLNTGRDGKEFILVDTVNATKKSVFDHQKLADALSLASGTKVDPSNLPFSDIVFMDEKIEFSALNKTWQYDLKTLVVKEIKSGKATYHVRKSSRNGEAYAINEIESAKATESGEMLSPDSKFAAFVQDHNLWVKEIATGKKYPLTFNGSEDYAFAVRSRTVLHPISQTRLNETAKPYAVWSPDSKKIATFRMDQRNVTPLYLLEGASI
jgi:hypothetical protein